MNKSAQIRKLHDDGMSIADISRVLGVRYQFAYNVVKFHVAQKEAEVLRYVAVSSEHADPVEARPFSWWSNMFGKGAFMERQAGTPTMHQM